MKFIHMLSYGLKIVIIYRNRMKMKENLAGKECKNCPIREMKEIQTQLLKNKSRLNK